MICSIETARLGHIPARPRDIEVDRPPCNRFDWHVEGIIEHDRRQKREERMAGGVVDHPQTVAAEVTLVFTLSDHGVAWDRSHGNDRLLVWVYPGRLFSAFRTG